MWVYRTTVGTFSIRPYRGGYGLYVADEYLGWYHSPRAAADDVFMCATSYWHGIENLLLCTLPIFLSGSFMAEQSTLQVRDAFFVERQPTNLTIIQIKSQPNTRGDGIPPCHVAQFGNLVSG